MGSGVLNICELFKWADIKFPTVLVILFTNYRVRCPNISDLFTWDKIKLTTKLVILGPGVLNIWELFTWDKIELPTELVILFTKCWARCPQYL